MPDTVEILGVPVEPVTTPQLLDAVYSRVSRQEPKPYVLGYQNLHGMYLFHKDPTLRAFREKADLVYVDGMPVVWAGKLGGRKITREHRTTSIDWIIELLKGLAERGVGVFFLGGKPEVADAGVACFREAVPNLALDYHHGYFDQKPGSADNEVIVEQINKSGAKVLFLCMGMPLQERWYLSHAEQLNVDVVWTLGAVLDYFGGAVKTPPRWMGQVGLEWLFRLVSEPKRLYYRYLVEPWSLLPFMAKDVLRRGKNRQS